MNKIIKENFNLEILELKKLDGYENENYLIITKNKKYIFKKYPYSPELATVIKGENEVLLFLSENKKKFPNPIKAVDGKYVQIHKINVTLEYTIVNLKPPNVCRWHLMYHLSRIQPLFCIFFHIKVDGVATSQLKVYTIPWVFGMIFLFQPLH